MICVLPYSCAAATSRSPALHMLSNVVPMAAIPLLVSTAATPPSRLGISSAAACPLGRLKRAYGVYDFRGRMHERDITPGTNDIMFNLAYFGTVFTRLHRDPLVSPIYPLTSTTARRCTSRPARTTHCCRNRWR
jgi:hypothetical protein